MQQKTLTPEQGLRQLCKSLGLSYEHQDWGIINANGSRLSEFMAYCEANPLSASQRFELSELILASANERLLSGKSLPEEFLPFLIRNRPAFEIRLGYWQNLRGESDFPIGSWLRTSFSEPGEE